MPTEGSDPLRPERSRSIGFVDRLEGRWSCVLVTFRAGAHRWKGYLSYRAPAGNRTVRTADLFLEASEPEIDRRVRALGRPMLSALLDSALEVEERAQAEARPTGEWLRTWLENPGAADDSRPSAPAPDGSLDTEEVYLRSRYATYRNEQVGHLVALLAPSDFDEVVERILEGRPFHFGRRDRLQFALAVVEHLEALLPLPPFEVWREDYSRSPETYERYSRVLRSRELP